MSTNTSSGAGPSTMARNIITGVITTVVGTTAVYFLGFHNRGGSSNADYLVVKEVTTNGWNNYVSAENIYQKNSQVLIQGYTEEGFTRYKEETLKESDKFKTSLKEIIETRDMDPIFVSLLKRRLSSWQQRDDKYILHLVNYEQILNTTTDAELKRQKIDAELTRYWKDVGDLDLRFRNEIEETTKILSSRYGRQFAITELIIFQPTNNNNNNNNNNGNNNNGTGGIDWKMLVGKWQTNANGAYVGTLYQYEDGRMYYYFFNGDSTYGRWQYNNNQVTLFYDTYYGAGYSFKYNLSDFTTNSYKMTFVDSPYNIFNVVKAN